MNGYSEVIQNVLDGILDIAERTELLAIAHNNDLSASIGTERQSIVRESLESIMFQQDEAREVLESIRNLLDDTLTIKEMSDGNRNANREAQGFLEEFRNTLEHVYGMLEGQVLEFGTLERTIEEIQRLFQDSFGKVRELNGLVEGHGVSPEPT